MDYEYYSVDPYNPLDPQTNPELTQAAQEAYEPDPRPFTDIFSIRGSTDGMQYGVFHDALFVRCRTEADLRHTLLGGIRPIKLFRPKRYRK